MTSCFIGWNIAIYALIASQLVLSGVLYSNNDIKNEIDQKNQTNYLKNEQENELEVKTEKFDKVLQAPLYYNETYDNKSKITDDDLKNVSANNISEFTYSNNNETLFQENLINSPEIFEEKAIFNDSEIINNFHKKNLTDDENFNKSNDEIDSERTNKVEKFNVPGNNGIDKLHNINYDFLKEIGEVPQIKKHNKREYNYRNDINYKDYYGRPPNHHFGNNKGYSNNNYLNHKYNRNENDEYLHRNKHGDDNEDDDEETEDDEDTDDDTDIDEYLEEILQEDDEIKRKFDIHKKSVDHPRADYDANVEAIQMFSLLLDNIITQKLHEMGVEDEELWISNSDKTKQRIENQNHKNSLVQRNNFNKAKNYNKEPYSKTSGKEPRNAQKINEIPESFNDNISQDSNHSLKAFEKGYKAKATDQRPFIIIQTNEDLNANDKNNANATMKHGDDVNDENKQKLDVGVKTEDEIPLDVKKPFRRNVDSISRPYFNEYSPPNNEFNFVKGYIDRDGEMNQVYNYPPNFQNNHVSRNVIDNNYRPPVLDNCSNEASCNIPPFQLINPQTSDLISVSLNDLIQSKDNIKNNIDYVPDRVTLYLIDNFLQNSPNQGNINGPLSEGMSHPRSSKTKRDLRSLQEDKINKENLKLDPCLVDEVVHNIEFLIKSHLSNVQGIPEKLTESQREIITKDILSDIMGQISDTRSVRQTNADSDLINYYHQMNSVQGDDNYLIDSTSGIKREIDKERCLHSGGYLHSHDCEKPCITIKNLNIFYEFAEDGKKCVQKRRHHPKRMEPEQPWKVINYEKRHLIPEKDLLKKSTILHDKAEDDQIDLLQSDFKSMLKRNSIDVINKRLGAMEIFQKHGSELLSKSDKNDLVINKSDPTIVLNEADENKSKTTLNDQAFINNSEEDSTGKNLFYREADISKQNRESSIEEKSQETKNYVEKSSSPVNEEGTYKTFETKSQVVKSNDKSGMETLIDEKTKEADEIKSLPSKELSYRAAKEKTLEKPKSASINEKSATKNQNDSGSNFNEFINEKSSKSPSVKYIKPPLPIMLNELGDLNKMLPSVPADFMTDKTINLDSDCKEDSICYRNSHESDLNQIDEQIHFKKIQDKTAEFSGDAKNKKETSVPQIEEGIELEGVHDNKKIDSWKDRIENRNTEDLINYDDELDKEERQTIDDENLNDSTVSENSQQIKTYDFEEFGEEGDSDKLELGRTEKNNANEANLLKRTMKKVNDRRQPNLISMKEPLTNNKSFDHKEESEDEINKGHVTESKKLKSSNHKLIKNDESDVKEQREIKENQNEDKEGALNEEEYVKIKKGGKKKATTHSNDYYKKESNSNKKRLAKNKNEKFSEINVSVDEDYQDDDFKDVLIVSIDDDNDFEYYHNDDESDDDFDGYDNHPNENARAKDNDDKDQTINSLNNVHKYKLDVLIDGSDLDDFTENENDELRREDEQSDMVLKQKTVDRINEGHVPIPIKRETSVKKPTYLNKKPNYLEDYEAQEDYDEGIDDTESDYEENIKEFYTQKKSNKSDKNRVEIKNGDEEFNEDYKNNEYIDDDNDIDDYDDNDDDIDEEEYIEEHKNLQKSNKSVMKVKNQRKEVTKNQEQDEYDDEKDNEQRKSIKNELRVKKRIKLQDEINKDYESNDEDAQEDCKQYKLKKNTKQDEKVVKLKKENAKRQDYKSNDEEYEDNTEGISEVTVLDLTKGFELEIKKNHVEDQISEDEEMNMNEKSNLKSDELLNDELSIAQSVQERKPKSVSQPNQRNDNHMANKISDETGLVSHKNYDSGQLENHFDDYVKKSDIEKIIKDLLDSDINPKEMFYNGPQTKYNELLEDIATYFTKKNVSAGDDVCIYEEYGSKHGDKDVIYLSGTKLYQNGVPKKDAQNFNLIIRKPHEQIDNNLKCYPKTCFKVPDDFSRKENNDILEKNHQKESLDVVENERKHHKRHAKSVNKRHSGHQGKQPYQKQMSHVKSKRKPLKNMNSFRG